MKIYQKVIASDLSSNDVLCGRGGSINAYPGNLQFRTIISKVKDSYRASKSNGDKSKIVERVVQAIRNMDPPGRFLKEHPDGEDCWIEIGDKEAKNKVVQAMRKSKARCTLKRLKSGDEGRTTGSSSSFSTASYSFSRTGFNEEKNCGLPEQQEAYTPLQKQSKIPTSFRQHQNGLSIVSQDFFSSCSSDLRRSILGEQLLTSTESLDVVGSTSDRDEHLNGTMVSFYSDDAETIRTSQQVPKPSCYQQKRPSLLTRDLLRPFSTDTQKSNINRANEDLMSSMSSMVLLEESDRFEKQENLNESLIFCPHMIPDNISSIKPQSFEEKPSSEILPSMKYSFKNLEERRSHFHNSLKDEQSILPPLMMVVLSSSKQDRLKKSLRRESIMRESLKTLSKLSIDMASVASEIISPDIDSISQKRKSRASSILSKSIINQITEITDAKNMSLISNRSNYSSSLVSTEMIDDLIIDLFSSDEVPECKPEDKGDNFQYEEKVS